MKLTICVKPEGTTIEISGDENKNKIYITKKDNKVCPVCGKEFIVTGCQKYCSKVCRHANWFTKYKQKYNERKRESKKIPITVNS